MDRSESLFLSQTDYGNRRCQLFANYLILIKAASTIDQPQPGGFAHLNSRGVCHAGLARGLLR